VKRYAMATIRPFNATHAPLRTKERKGQKETRKVKMLAK
jgi:hypothetical protein